MRASLPEVKAIGRELGGSVNDIVHGRGNFYSDPGAATQRLSKPSTLLSVSKCPS